jgi:hypothetical protein
MGLKAVANLGSGGGGGGISGSGSAGYLAQFTGSTAIGDSPIRASGTNVAIDTSVSGSFKLKVNGDTDIVGRIDAISSRISTMSSGLSNDLVLQRDGVTAATIKVGAIATLTGATPAATNGSYSQLALTGGTGTGATADIVVASGAVSSVTLRAPGNGYTAGDLLTCPTLTGLGVGVTVATVATVIADVEGTANITASGRLGAFTADPRAGLDVASGGGMISGATRLTLSPSGSNSSIETMFALHGTVNPTASNYGVWLVPQYDLTAGTINNPTIRGIECSPSISASSAGTTQSVSVTGANITAQRWSASDLSTISTSLISAVRGTATIGASTGAASTASVQCFNGLYQVAQAAHTVTSGSVYTGRVSHTGTTTTLSLYGIDTATFSNSGTIGTLYGLRLPTITNTGTITTRYGISQEDTAAINQFAGTVQYNNGFGSVATVYGTRAWVNFNGTGVVAIRGSGNVSTITDLGVGSYSVNFTTSMPDVNYSAHATVGYDGTVGSGIVASVDRNSAAAAVGSVRVYLFSTTFAVADSTMVFVSVSR